jgi:hypothetical protein
LKLHRSIVGNKKKHQYRYRNRKYLFFAILTTLVKTDANYTQEHVPKKMFK